MELSNPNLKLGKELTLSRCPHCGVDTPSLHSLHAFETRDYKNGNQRFWNVYVCKRCGGVLTASAERNGFPVRELYPASTVLDASIPGPAKSYLEQAMQSLHVPSGAVMLAERRRRHAQIEKLQRRELVRPN